MKWRHTEVCFRSEHCLLIGTKVRQKMILRATNFVPKVQRMQIPSLNLICSLLLLQPSQPFSLLLPDAARIRNGDRLLPTRPTAQQALCLSVPRPFLIQADNSPYMYPWMSQERDFSLLPRPTFSCTSHSSPLIGKAGTKASASVYTEACTAAELLIRANPWIWQKPVFPFSASVSLQRMVLLLSAQAMGPRGWKDSSLVLPQPPVTYGAHCRSLVVTTWASLPTQHP